MEPDTIALQSVAVNTAASGGDSVITVGASGAGTRNVIDKIIASYDGAITSGALTITNVDDGAGAAVTITVDITQTGFNILDFRPPGLRGLTNTANVVTLVDGSAGKELTVIYR